MSAALNTRGATRYRLSLPVSFWWRGPDESIESFEGITKNISSGGVLVAACRCPPLTEIVELAIRLPRLEGSGCGMELRGEGAVLRIHHEPTIHGSSQSEFAVCVHLHPHRMEISESFQPWETADGPTRYCN